MEMSDWQHEKHWQWLQWTHIIVLTFSLQFALLHSWLNDQLQHRQDWLFVTLPPSGTAYIDSAHQCKTWWTGSLWHLLILQYPCLPVNKLKLKVQEVTALIVLHFEKNQTKSFCLLWGNHIHKPFSCMCKSLALYMKEITHLPICFVNNTNKICSVINLVIRTGFTIESQDVHPSSINTVWLISSFCSIWWLINSCVRII